MMKKLPKEKVKSFLEKLLKDYEVLGPRETAGFVSFGRIMSPGELKLNYQNSTKAPKEAFFPQWEVMFRYGNTDQSVEVKSTEAPGVRRILFGIRPCDIRAALLLDLVFDSPDSKDPYYINKRKGTIVVGLGCNHPASTCFCTSVNGGPFSREGADLFMTDLGDGYLVEVLSPRGRKLIQDLDGRGASQEDKERARAIENAATRGISSVVETNGLMEKLEKMTEAPFWDFVYEKCLGCGICTYLCPTCHCFDIADEAFDLRGQRVRYWDSCLFPLFTLETSGHNPRPTGRERIRQRIMHKFNYFLSTHKAIACVGCGRCIIYCPVNFDIRRVIDDIHRE
jgi:sulfhydrogenase subunit beta (sulfur reductase)